MSLVITRPILCNLTLYIATLMFVFGHWIYFVALSFGEMQVVVGVLTHKVVESTSLWTAEAKLWTVVDFKISTTKRLWSTTFGCFSCLLLGGVCRLLLCFGLGGTFVSF